MASRAVLITGATGKQGGAVIDALLKANAPYEILALTRDASSRIKLVTGNLDAAESVFKKAKEATKAPVWGVFSVQAVGKSEETQGKALVNAALRNGVEHVVYSSADRGGSNSDYDPTNVPHFITKHNIEQHIFSKSQNGNATYTILRPVAFYENLAPDFFGKVFTASWAVKMPKERKLQLISTQDIGFFGAQSLMKSDDPMYKNKSMSLASEALSFKEFEQTFEKATGEKLPMTLASNTAQSLDSSLPAILIPSSPSTSTHQPSPPLPPLPPIAAWKFAFAYSSTSASKLPGCSHTAGMPASFASFNNVFVTAGGVITDNE
ncbi:NAD(P)-binding protein [Stemphylium lycopersici]|uniref:NAD(P)-binding protein n=1 Tax=Stemphylium lycopersici TaxID=183478 RepID=A0A364NCA9_STELY|nr:NAD(P)-binding protein [Stemphylium lycopersici]